jgi:hypothetical protein
MGRFIIYAVQDARKHLKIILKNTPKSPKMMLKLPSRNKGGD